MIDSCFPHPVHPPFEILPIALLATLTYGVYQAVSSSHPSFKLQRLLQIYCVALPGFLIVTYLKYRINDYTCSEIPNSVSGHTYFNVFFSLQWLVLIYNNFAVKSVFHQFYFIFVEFWHVANIIYTYLGGFHTPRQIFYGALLAIVTVIFLKLMENKQTSFYVKYYFLNITIWSAVVYSYTKTFDFVKMQVTGIMILLITLALFQLTK